MVTIGNWGKDWKSRSYLRPPEVIDQEPGWPPLKRIPLYALWGAGQIVLFLVLFQAYKSVRKTYITRAEKVAYDNAKDILHFEEWLRLDFELPLQKWVLDQGSLIKVFNYFYAYYMWGFYTIAIILLFLCPVRYLYLRRVFILSMIIALPWYVIYPLAPPRFMGQFGWDFMDTTAVYGPVYFKSGGLVTANRFAAMPSMHCGWSMIAGIMIAAALPWKHIGRYLGIFLTLFMGMTVMVTGNHYWLDIVGGWIVVGISLAVNRWLPYPLPIRWPWNREPEQIKGAVTPATSASD